MFRVRLDQHRTQVRQSLDQVRNEVQRLSVRWKDQQFQSFQTSVKRTVEKMDVFLETTRRQDAHLRELVEIGRQIGRDRLI